MNTLGGFLKWYAGNDYTIALIGQCCVGFSYACMKQSPAGNRFSASEAQYIIYLIVFSHCWEMVSTSWTFLGTLNRLLWNSVWLDSWIHHTMLIYGFLFNWSKEYLRNLPINCLFINRSRFPQCISLIWSLWQLRQQ